MQTPCMQPHFTPTSSPPTPPVWARRRWSGAPPHSHLYFGYKLPVRHVPPSLVSAAAKDRATLHIHSTHSINTRKHPTPTRLGQVYKRALVVPSLGRWETQVATAPAPSQRLRLVLGGPATPSTRMPAVSTVTAPLVVEYPELTQVTDLLALLANSALTTPGPIPPRPYCIRSRCHSGSPRMPS